MVVLANKNRGVSAPAIEKKHDVWVWLLVAIAFAVGLFFRVFELDKLPATAYVDEGINGLEAIRILTDPSYRPVYSGDAQEPAFFFYLIAAVFRVAGVGLLQMKVVTVAASAGTILALFLFVRRAWGNKEAVLAAFFLATSRWHFSIGRTAFIGSLSPFFDVLTYYFLLRGFQKRSITSFVFAGVTLGLGLNTYYTSRMAPVVAFVLIVVLAIGSRDRKTAIGRSILAVPSLFVVCLPLALFAFGNPGLFFQRIGQINSVKGGLESVGLLANNVAAYLLMFNVAGDLNGRHNIPGEPMLDLVTGLLFLIGLVYLAFNLRRGQAWFTLSWLLLSLLPGVLSEDAPHALRTLPVAVVSCLIAALGLVAVSRLLPSEKARWVLFASVIAAISYLNFNTYFVNGVSQTWAWFEPRESLVGQFAAAEARSGETVLLSGPYAGHPTVDFMAWPEDQAAADRDYVALLASHPDGFEVIVPTASVPEGFTQLVVPAGVDVVARKGTLLPNLQPAFIVLNVKKASSEALHPAANFGSRIALIDYRLNQNDGSLSLSTKWEATAKMSEELRLSLRLVDQDGYEWGGVDRDLLEDYPSYLWPERLMVENNYEFLPSVGTPPGDYKVQLTVYRLPDLQQLAVSSDKGLTYGTALDVGSLKLDKLYTVGSKSDVQTPVAQFGSELEMISGSTSQGLVGQGESIEIDITWRARETPGADLTAFIEFSNESGIAYSDMKDIGEARTPARSWAKGDIVLQQERLTIPADLAPGRYTVSLGVGRKGGDTRLPLQSKQALVLPSNSVKIGEVEVKGRTRTFDLPAAVEKLDASFGKSAKLVGFSVLNSVGAPVNTSGTVLNRSSSLRVVLYWQAGERFQDSYTVFVHLLDQSGRLVAQHDGIPANRTAPTTSWLQGEVIEDFHGILLPLDFPQGSYRIEAGLYEANFGKRLGRVGGADSAVLGTVFFGDEGGGGK